MTSAPHRAVGITVVHVEGCPSVASVVDHLTVAADITGVQLSTAFVVVHDADDAVRAGMNGSPTLLIAGNDPFPSAAAGAFGCRLYESADGLRGTPSVAQLAAMLLAASDVG